MPSIVRNVTGDIAISLESISAIELEMIGGAVAVNYKKGEIFSYSNNEIGDVLFVFQNTANLLNFVVKDYMKFVHIDLEYARKLVTFCALSGFVEDESEDIGEKEFFESIIFHLSVRNKLHVILPNLSPCTPSKRFAEMSDAASHFLHFLIYCVAHEIAHFRPRKNYVRRVPLSYAVWESQEIAKIVSTSIENIFQRYINHRFSYSDIRHSDPFFNYAVDDELYCDICAIDRIFDIIGESDSTLDFAIDYLMSIRNFQTLFELLDYKTRNRNHSLFWHDIAANKKIFREIQFYCAAFSRGKYLCNPIHHKDFFQLFSNKLLRHYNILYKYVDKVCVRLREIEIDAEFPLPTHDEILDIYNAWGFKSERTCSIALIPPISEWSDVYFNTELLPKTLRSADSNVLIDVD